MSAPPTIPDHDLIAVVGRGSYGEVWLARNVLGTLRAIKVVRRGEFRSAKPFEREFAGIQRFEPVSRSHEGLMDILQVGRNDAEGYFYSVMELADDANATGETSGSPPADASVEHYVPRTLATELARRKRLPPEECYELFHRLAEALAHLHAEGLVHRDIKPSNIIFVRGIPKFADIGLVSGAGETGSYVGTEGFIPPEGSGSAAADIYSLGKVLYETSTGKDRLEFPTLPDDANLAEQAGLLELNAVIVKACANDPTQRHASAAQLATDLGELRAGRSIKAQRRVERRRRQARMLILPLLAVTVLLPIVIYITNRLGQHPVSTTGGIPPVPTAATDLLAQARRLRVEAQPGWRSAALESLTRAAAIQPSAELRQEAIHVLAGADLRPLPWSPPESAAPLLFDFARDRYATADRNGVIIFRSLRDYAELWRNDREIGPVERFLSFSGDGHWLILLDQAGHFRFRRCDPGTGAWSWTNRRADGGHASLNSDGSLALFTRPEDEIVLARTENMAEQRLVDLPGHSLKSAWAPDDHAVAVLVESPPALMEIGPAGEVRRQTRLPGSPVALAWLRDSSAILVAGQSQVWLVRPGNSPEMWLPDLSGIRSMDLDETGQLLALVTGDQLEVYDLRGKRLHARTPAVAERVALSPTGRRIVTYAPGGTHASLWEFGLAHDVVAWVDQLPPGGNSLAVDREGVRYPISPKGPTLLLPVPSKPTEARLMPETQQLYVRLADGTVQCWNLARLRERLESFGLGWTSTSP